MMASRSYPLTTLRKTQVTAVLDRPSATPHPAALPSHDVPPQIIATGMTVPL